MADELDQTNKSEDSLEAKIELLHIEIGRLTCENSILQSLMERSTKRLGDCYEKKESENAEGNHHSLNDQLTSAKKENDDLKSVNTLLTKKLQVKEKDFADLGHRSNVLFHAAKSEHEKLTIEIKNLNDQLTSAKKENDDLQSVNTLLTKRLRVKEKDSADLGHRSNVLFHEAKLEQEKLRIEIKNLKLQTEKQQSEIQNMKLENDKLILELENVKLQKLQTEKQQSEIQNMKLENDKLISELENVKLQNETSPSELVKLTVLYRCSEKEKSIASMKLLEAEENIRRLRNELHSLQNSIASKNETKRHKNDNNGEKVQTSLDVGSEVNESESEKPDTSATESIEKRHKGLLEKEVIGKTDKLCEEFEAKFHEKRSYLITKLTSCDDQMQALKKLCVKLKEEKLKLVDLMEGVDGIMFQYRKQRECV